MIYLISLGLVLECRLDPICFLCQYKCREGKRPSLASQMIQYNDHTRIQSNRPYALIVTSYSTVVPKPLGQILML